MIVRSPPTDLATWQSDGFDSLPLAQFAISCFHRKDFVRTNDSVVSNKKVDWAYGPSLTWRLKRRPEPGNPYLMSKRPALHCERLERRELPANSFGLTVLPLDLLHAAPLTAPAAPTTAFYWVPPHEGDAPALAARTGELSSEAVGAFFAKQTSF